MIETPYWTKNKKWEKNLHDVVSQKKIWENEDNIVTKSYTSIPSYMRNFVKFILTLPFMGSKMSG